MDTTSHYSHGRWQKLWRYVRTYGLRRTLVKAAGRRRKGKGWFVTSLHKHPRQTVSFIGCGQAAFGTLSFFLARNKGRIFLDAYDPDRPKAESLARFYGFSSVANTAEEVLQNPALKTVYIASNHASHAAYALAALDRGLEVFVEKPLCTSWAQLRALESAVATRPGSLHVGYNRPFAEAIRMLHTRLQNKQQPLTLACYVHGHAIPPGHWYRGPAEGSRILGNASHWLDLAVHLFKAVHGVLPEWMDAQYLPAKSSEPDDNFSLTLRTKGGDLVTLHAASRNEPFEGVRESIEVQCGNISAQIDDFRSMRIWEGSRKFTQRFRPKDVGHKKCTLQPFLAANAGRDWTEVVCSTRLSLHVATLAAKGGGATRFDLSSTPATSFDVS